MSSSNSLDEITNTVQGHSSIGHSSVSPRNEPSTSARSLSVSSSTPQVPATDSNLNPRSCVTCRRRKVRCNKREPCSNCVKAGIDCIFPGPGRAPRKARRPPDVELLTRLRRLEGVVESLGGTDAIEKLITSNRTDVPQTISPPQASFESPNSVKEPTISEVPEWRTSASQHKGVNEELGRLVIDDTKSLYVSNRYWTSIGDQIEELQDILDSPSEEESENTTSPENSAQSPGNQRGGDAFLFGYNSLAHTLRNYHPTPTQAFILWKTYEQNVAPLLTIIHKPTARNMLINAAMNVESLDKCSEALIFSMYLAAVISMSPEQCLAELGDDRESAISRFRFATEQALARANLLNSRNINLLQAAVLFISSIHRQDTTRFVWTMSAVMLRIASGLGIHRDGTNFGLSPFETEMRRRLWWHIFIVDVRTAEDHGTDPMISETMYDTKLPLNINDDDISPDSKTFPSERVGFTEMTFTLIRSQISIIYRRLNYIPPGQNSVATTLEQRKKTIEDLHDTLNDKYIRYCDMQEPLQWSCATMARLVIAKLWLVVHHPMIKSNLPTLSRDDRNRILLTSIEVIEFARLLETSESTKHWSWLFGSYVQWHAIAFVLAELCVRPRCPGVDRAWLAIDSTFHEWERTSMGKKKSLWRPLTKLHNKAKAFRTREDANSYRGCPNFAPFPASTPTPMIFGKSPQQYQVQQPPLQQQRHSSTGSTLNYMDGNPSQFSSPVQSTHVSKPGSSMPETASNNTLAADNGERAMNPAPEFSLDLKRSMPDLLNDLLPAYSLMPSDASGMYSPTKNDNMGTNTSNLKSPPMTGLSPANLPYNTTANSWPLESPNLFDTPMQWDQFDDVMRDFQQEFEEVAGQESRDYQLRFM